MNNIWAGKKIKLRAVELSDFENYFGNVENIDTDSQRKGNRADQPISKELIRQRVESLANTIWGNEDNFLIMEDSHGNPVGNINVHSCSRIDGTFEYGLGVRSKYRGKGYASDAIRLILNFYFNELGYQKVNVKIYSFNEGSIKLHERLGFMLEGRLRRSFYGDGEYHDILCYGMTREEFKNKSK